VTARAPWPVFIEAHRIGSLLTALELGLLESAERLEAQGHRAQADQVRGAVLAVLQAQQSMRALATGAPVAQGTHRGG